MNVQVHDDPHAAASAAADLVLTEMRALRGKILLAGGESWRQAYLFIGERAVPGDYKRAHIFIGDDRAVSPDDIESVYGMIKRAWLDPSRVPPEKVHRLMGELDPERAARLAEDEVRSVAGAHAALDLALLGMTVEGRTASLFPGSAAMEETDRLFVPSDTQRRITATITLINACRRVVFLATGASKAEAVHAALCEPPGAVPASLVGSPGQPPLWILDRAAAALL